MKKVLFLDTSIATSNIGDEIINISIKNNFPEIFNDNYIYNLPTHTRTFTWYQKLIYKKECHYMRRLIISFYVEQMPCILIC